MSSMLEKLNQMKEEVSEKEITYPEMSESVHMENKEQPVQSELIIQQIKSLEQKLNNQSSLDKEQIKYMVSEMTSLSALIRQSNEKQEKLTEQLATEKKTQEESKKQLLEKTNKIIQGLQQEMADLKKTNYQKIEEMTKVLQRTQGTTQEIFTKSAGILHDIGRMEKAKTWKERVIQYSIQLGVTIGLILMIVGAYHLITYLIK